MAVVGGVSFSRAGEWSGFPRSYLFGRTPPLDTRDLRMGLTLLALLTLVLAVLLGLAWRESARSLRKLLTCWGLCAGSLALDVASFALFASAGISPKGAFGRAGLGLACSTLAMGALSALFAVDALASRRGERAAPRH
jgi:hypothetical protein